MIRLTIWKGGQGSCIFNSCTEKGISAGVVCTHAAPGEIPLFITTAEAAGALPTFVSGHSRYTPSDLTIVMEREFHQVLHAYK